MRLEKTIIDTSKGVGLVLGGGGARGAYQAGAVYALAEIGIKFNLFAGTSVGALNSGLGACDKIADMIKIWENITPSDVFEFGITNPFNGFFLNNRPLEKMIRREIDEDAFNKFIESKVKLIVVSSCAQTKMEVVHNIFRDRFQFHRALITSSAIPVAFPLFKSYTQKEKNEYVQEFDGGFIDNFPLNKAIKAGLCKTFFTISLYTPETKRPEDERKYDNDLGKIGFRALDVLLTNTYLKEISEVKEKIEIANSLKKLFKNPLSKVRNNQLYEKYLKLKPYEDVKIIEINPSGECPSELDFFAKKSKIEIDKGYANAHRINRLNLGYI